jgi:hypothetical protein
MPYNLPKKELIGFTREIADMISIEQKDVDIRL